MAAVKRDMLSTGVLGQREQDEAAEEMMVRSTLRPLVDSKQLQRKVAEVKCGPNTPTMLPLKVVEVRQRSDTKTVYRQTEVSQKDI